MAIANALHQTRARAILLREPVIHRVRVRPGERSNPVTTYEVHHAFFKEFQEG